MQLLTINRGELGERVRRFFGITGPTPLKLEATVYGMAQLGDLAAAPYRALGSNGFVRGATQAAVAAQYSTVGVRVPADRRGVAVVHRIVIQNDDPANQSFQLDVLYDPLTAASPCYNTDQLLVEETPGTWTPARTQPDLFAYNSATTTGFRLYLVELATKATHTIEGPFVVRPGRSLYVHPVAQNVATRAHFFGEWFAEVP